MDSTDFISDFIRNVVGLPQYETLFLEHHITRDTVTLLNMHMMRSELGIQSLGHRLRILRAIEQLEGKPQSLLQDDRDPSGLEPAGVYLVAMKAHEKALFNQMSIGKGDIVRANWNESNSGYVMCRKVDAEGGGGAGLLPIDILRPCGLAVPKVLPADSKLVYKDTDNDVLLLKETHFFKPTLPNDSSGGFSLAQFMSDHAPVIEPGLSSFVWPLSIEDFLGSVCGKRAFACLASADRLVALKDTLHGFDVEKLVDTCESSVVWMKTTAGEMHHFAADPGLSKLSYHSGCTLDFNPSLDIQKMYVEPMAEDLGWRLGLQKDGGFGGSMEMFAVKGSHVTGWHWDSQDNFTVQLRGTKRWSIYPGIVNPVHNCNMIRPTSNKYSTYTEQKRVHASYSSHSIPPNFDAEKVQTFILRPGSVFYFPSGYWHHVVAESDDVGSLSINYSFATTTWLDMLQSCMVQLLWRQPVWRRPVQLLRWDSAVNELERMLRDLPTAVRQLRSADMLPQALMHERRRSPVSVINESERFVPVAEDDLFVCNPLAVLHKSTRDELAWHALEDKRIHAQRESEKNILEGKLNMELDLLFEHEYGNEAGLGKRKSKRKFEPSKGLRMHSSSAPVEYELALGIANREFAPLYTATFTSPPQAIALLDWIVFQGSAEPVLLGSTHSVKSVIKQFGTQRVSDSLYEESEMSKRARSMGVAASTDQQPTVLTDADVLHILGVLSFHGVLSLAVADDAEVLGKGTRPE